MDRTTYMVLLLLTGIVGAVLTLVLSSPLIGVLTIVVTTLLALVGGGTQANFRACHRQREGAG